MKRLLFIIGVLLTLLNTAHAQKPNNYPPDNKNVKIVSTNLPIVWIEVGGAMILKDERITARMKIIHNGNGQLNYADTVAHPGQRIDYEGYIGIRYRGNSTFAYGRKPYSFRPLDKPLEEGGVKKKVDILGMGKDNNWALLAPYFDRSMIRDMLAYSLARPWMEYTPEGRHCEVYLDGIYYGVYVLVEVVSKGKTRLNLDDPGTAGDAITGGYIMELDRNEPPVYVSAYAPTTNAGKPIDGRYIYYQYNSPDYEDMVTAQINYITKQIYMMESAFASKDYCDPETGYRKYIDVMSFIDYQLAQELAHNLDAYRYSVKLFKRRDSVDPRFKLALWDMDMTYGLANYNAAWYTHGWRYHLNDTLLNGGDSNFMPLWWIKLNDDPEYTAALKNRWKEYRRSNVAESRVMAVVDSLALVLTTGGAIDRNSQAWPRWGQYVWPNYYVSDSFEDEIAYLKRWIKGRIAWMDLQLGFDSLARDRGDVNGDYLINVKDVTTLINYLMTGDKTLIYRLAADCNQDLRLNIRDVTTLINYLMSGQWPK